MVIIYLKTTKNMRCLFTNNPLLTFVSLGVGLFCLCSSVYAFPFKSNASAFEKYLNSLTWDDGKKRVFYQLRKCEFLGLQKSFGTEPPTVDDFAKCAYGYMMIFSPLGKKTCELSRTDTVYQGVWYRKELKRANKISNEPKGVYWNIITCING